MAEFLVRASGADKPRHLPCALLRGVLSILPAPGLQRLGRGGEGVLDAHSALPALGFACVSRQHTHGAARSLEDGAGVELLGLSNSRRHGSIVYPRDIPRRPAS